MSVLKFPDNILGKILNKVQTRLNITSINQSEDFFNKVGDFINKIGFTDAADIEFIYALLVLNFKQDGDYTTITLNKPVLKNFTLEKKMTADAFITETYNLETYFPEIIGSYVNDFALDPYNTYTDYDNYDVIDIEINED